MLRVLWKAVISEHELENKTASLCFSLFCSDLYGRKKTEYFCIRDEAKKKDYCGETCHEKCK